MMGSSAPKREQLYELQLSSKPFPHLYKNTGLALFRSHRDPLPPATAFLWFW